MSISLLVCLMDRRYGRRLRAGQIHKAMFRFRRPDRCHAAFLLRDATISLKVPQTKGPGAGGSMLTNGLSSWH
ncbi:MAG: hypothetical protein K0M47_26825, partial [Rhizobium sp.]|nr:hypothetical protein [Rhizobium sp.]